MAEEIEFELEHDLDYEDAVEVIYEMLDAYYENDDFDELEWDEDEGMAFLGNEAMEVEIYVDDELLEVWAEIYDEDMSPREVKRNLRNDLMEFFEVEEERPRRRRSGAPRTKSSGRERRNDREESRRPTRGRKKKKGGNWDMEEETPEEKKSSEKMPVKQEKGAEEVEESGSSMGWIIFIVLIIAAIVGFVFFKT